MTHVRAYSGAYDTADFMMHDGTADHSPDHLAESL